METVTRGMRSIENIASEAIEWRRELHRHPQTMYEEYFASDFICGKLDQWGISYERGIAKTGVVASIEGRRNQSGRAIALRADMDALNIVEASGQPWSSETPGKMHGCGHDGHTATLLTAARYLQETRDFDGVVRLIFQPAEEGGRGAHAMLQEGLLERFPFDEIYGYHNWPWLPRGVFAIRSGVMLAAADTFEVRLVGAGGHAAMPHLCRDVVPATAHIVMALQALVSRETDPQDSAVLSVTSIEAGSSGANNVISPSARLGGTVRTFKQSTQDTMEVRMKVVAEGIAHAFDLSSQFTYNRITDPVLNDPESTRQCQLAAAAIVGEDNIKDFEPIMGGEDFGGFLQERPGAFMAIGQREPVSSPCNFGLHSPNYDFNDAIIPLAASYFAEIVERRLPLD